MQHQSIANPAGVGFIYLAEHLRAGEIIDSSFQHNLMPEEGRNHVLSAAFKKAAQQDWYMGLYENNTTPTDALVAATLAATLGESTAYAPGTRPAFVPGTPAGGAIDNVLSRAEFTFTAPRRIYGGFIVSSPTKGSALGYVVSAVRFDTYKDMAVGDTLRLTAAFNLVSAG